MVCLSVTTVSPAKRLNRSRCRLAIALGWAEEPCIRLKSRSPHVNGAIGKWTGPGHARTCSTVDVLKATRRGLARIRCRYDEVHVVAAWRILVNRPCAAAMQPYVKLFDHLLYRLAFLLTVLCCYSVPRIKHAGCMFISDGACRAKSIMVSYQNFQRIIKLERQWIMKAEKNNDLDR